ncbi:50S ribosome-binding protein YggL [Bacterioplanoides sp.]|uniref:50S ribosome-binding protein YggL n=1 Tax=Bacterioplanoides sp. TaxID=2066072 RepID=UPI003B00E6CF
MSEDIFKQKPKPSRNRSKRLRKKLFLDEFQELGFEIRAEFHTDEDELLDDVIDYIEAQTWIMGGGVGQGILQGYLCGPANTVNDKALSEFALWLEKQGCENISFGTIHDATYGQL